MTGAQLILKERKRQIEVEHYDATHDDKANPGGQLAIAAACYVVADTQALCLVDTGVNEFIDAWPWDPKLDKRDHQPRIAELTKAGALIAAEIDRLLRKGEKP